MRGSNAGFRPRMLASDEGVELRPDARLAVERTEGRIASSSPSSHPAEQTRAAPCAAESLHAPAVRPEDADQLLTGEQAEPFTRTRLRQAHRVLSAA